MRFWKPKKAGNDSQQQSQDWQDTSIDCNPDVQNPQSYKEKLNQSNCRGRDNETEPCRDEAVHHESEGQADGRSGWCLKHWLGGSDDNE